MPRSARLPSGLGHLAKRAAGDSEIVSGWMGVGCGVRRRWAR